MKRRGSLFFTLDTLFAVILIVTVFSILGFGLIDSTQQDDPQQGIDQANNFFINTNVRLFLAEYPGIYDIQGYDSQSDVWRGDMSLYQEVSHVYQTRNRSRAKNLTKDVMDLVLSPRYNYELRIGNRTLAERATLPKDQAIAFVKNRELIYTPTNGSKQLIGPNVTTLSVWI